MKVVNVHERVIESTPDRVGALLDTLASDRDRLWPRPAWPPMKFDRPLAVGATGGHGPVGYSIEQYEPGRSIRFRFSRPSGFRGFHAYEIHKGEGRSTVLRHTLEMNARGAARFTWPLFFRPLHDALIEDSLSKANESLGLPDEGRPWSPWVRFLRRLAARAGRTGSPTTRPGPEGDRRP